MRTSDFYYHLPKSFIAQHPVEPRDASKLLVYDRQRDQVEHLRFSELGKKLRAGDLLVINQTRVIRARVHGRKLPTGGKVELLLLREKGPGLWECLAGGKGIVPGIEIRLNQGPLVKVEQDLGGPLRLIRFPGAVDEYLDQLGEVPLPPYIHHRLEDPDRYQTVFALEKGSAAAPTAGLHFTPGLLASLKDQGVQLAQVTLHVGLDTFAPVQEADPLEHHIHSEWCQLSQPAAELINQTRSRGGRVIAVGTTSVRTLETAVRAAGPGAGIAPFQGNTDLYILPGFQFQAVDCLLTNFHLPESTLLMLVSAFCGREKILDLYRLAMENAYRFYSFGDAMLIV